MALSYVAPTPELAIELSEVRADAAALVQVFVQLNAPLPDSFPKEAVIEVASALQQLPDGTAHGCLRPLNEVQSQLAAIRSQHIVHDDHSNLTSEQERPPLFRGEPVDQKLRALMSSVSTALQTANRLETEEPEPEKPEAAVEAPRALPIKPLIEESTKAQRELQEERLELDGVRTPTSRHADILRRTLTDALVLNWLGRGELLMRRIVPARLRRIGGTLREYPTLIRQAAEVISKGTERLYLRVLMLPTTPLKSGTF